MGKGDKRTKRGKLYRGTNGKTNPGKKMAHPAKPEPKAVVKTPRAPREPRETATPPPAPAPVAEE